MLKFEGIFAAFTNIEIVNLPELIKNEKKSPVGVFEELDTEFRNVEIVRQKGQSFFVVSDSSGHIT